MLWIVSTTSGTSRPISVCLGQPRKPSVAGPVPDGRDRSPQYSVAAGLRQPVPGCERPVLERVFCEKGPRDRSLAGRDRFPNVGSAGQAQRPVPGVEETGPSARKVPRPGSAQGAFLRDLEKEKEKKEKKEKEMRGAYLEALEHHLLPHFSPLVAWSLRLELCGGSNFNPIWF
uniref:Uncharacterized protein n=1 Tax=Ananas comosus var. bracteatus TaxID=296719 RepID=A0A6V7PH96_ANACO|nr:unnamed protein product [Ananas comosus var. bracteatus]